MLKLINLLQKNCGSFYFVGENPEIELVKILLKKYFKINVLAESKDIIECKLIRTFRGFFFPYLGPHTRLRIERVKDIDNYELKYSLTFPEYIWAIILPFPVGIASFYPDILLGVGVSIFLFLFLSILIFLDTKAVIRCFKGLLSELKNQL